MVHIIKTGQLRWDGHVIRMDGKVNVKAKAKLSL